MVFNIKGVFYVTRSGESVGAVARSKLLLRVKYTDLSLAEGRGHYVIFSTGRGAGGLFNYH